MAIDEGVIRIDEKKYLGSRKRRANERENEAHRIGLHNAVCSGGNGKIIGRKETVKISVNPTKVKTASRFST